MHTYMAGTLKTAPTLVISMEVTGDASAHNPFRCPALSEGRGGYSV